MKARIKQLGRLSLVTLLILSVSMTAVANYQLSVDEFDIDNVYYAIGEDLTTGETIISPTMVVSWEDPSAWADDIDYHEPDYYEITVDNITLDDDDVITIQDTDGSYDSKTFDIHEEVTLETGSLYRLTLQPYHYHETESDGVTTRVLATNTDLPEVAYGVTDLDVEFITEEDSIQVIWDDIGEPEFEYRIVYAVGDYTGESKSTLEANKEGEVSNLTMDSDDVTSYFDAQSNRQKLTYTIDQNIYPGQIYSVMVEPTTTYFDGYALVKNVNYPYVRSVSTDIVLNLTEEGDYIRLTWDIPSSFQVGQSQEEYSLVEGTIVESQGGSSRNLVVFDGEAATIGYYRVAKPIWETDYQLKLVYDAVDDISKESITPESNVVTFAPSEYYIQPTLPYIPELISQSMMDAYELTYTSDEIYDVLEDKHLVPGYAYSGDVDDLLEEEVTFHVDSTNNYIHLVWGAFQRIDVDETSLTYGDFIYDTNVYYDIWVTDALSTLAYAQPVGEDLRFSSATSDYVILDDEGEIVGYKQPLSTYYSSEEKAIIDITPGDLYYIKIVAKKINSNETLQSEANIKTVYYGYDGDSFEPPNITKPPLQEKSDVTDTNSVTLIWRESWTEIMSSDLNETGVLGDWLLEVWADEAGNVYDVETDGADYFPIYEGADTVEEFEDFMSDNGVAVDLIERTIDLGTDEFGVSDIEYDFAAITYQSVLDAISEEKEEDSTYDFAKYYEDLIAGDKDGSAPINWETIDPTTDVDDEAYLAYQRENLVANTSYMFVLYPYRTLDNGDVLYAHYPGYIVVTTEPEEVIISPDPTVPALYTTDVDATSITLSWKYNTDFSYELAYGTVDDVDQAEALDFAIPTDASDLDAPVDGGYYDYVVDDLFPLETYYFWIKAIQTSDGSESTWSNPASGTTTDVDQPLPPKGFGIASKKTRETYGYDLSVSEDHIIYEWIYDTEDPDGDSATVDTDSDVTWTYAYILEVSDNRKFVDPVYIVSSGGVDDTVPSTAQLLEKNVALVESLVGNRTYYARAKTRVTVTGSLAGQEIIKESKYYTDTVRVVTLSSSDEYDGYIDPALTILPEEDFELIYNDVSHLLEYRFRSDGVDADGHQDNQVDQRLISSLITDQVYEYVIDLDSFNDQEIERRRITIPYSIMEAFDAHDIDLKVLADTMVFEVEAKGIMGSINDQKDAFGVAPMVIIDLENLDSKSVLESLPVASLSDVSVAQELQMKVSSSRATSAIYYTDTPMSLALKTKSRYQVYEKDLAVYVKDKKADWTSLDGVYDRYTSMMAFETPVVGSYGVYTYDRPSEAVGNTNTQHWSEAYRKEVYEAVTLEGLDAYNPKGTVSEKAVVQAVYGTVTQAPLIDLTATLNPTDLLTLQRAGIKGDNGQGEGTISRQEAIAMFARGVEILSSNNVQVTDTMIGEALGAGASQTYAGGVAKAKAQGLVTDLSGLRANDSLTYGEFFTIWSRALK